MIGPEQLLRSMPSATLTDEGMKWVSHGRAIGGSQLSGTLPEGVEWVRLLSPDHTLAAIAQPAGPRGSLHPSVVLI